MLFVRVNSRFSGKLPLSVVRSKRRQYSAAVTQNHETATTPEYPPILDQSFGARYRRTRENLAKEIENCRTIEEKLIKINMPRYYGWRSLMLNESVIRYNSVDQMQYFTRTHVTKEPGLPSYYDHVVTPEKMKETVDKLRGSIEDSLVFEYSSRKRSEELDKSILECPQTMDDIVSCAVSKQVHRCLVSHLAADKPHLLEAEIDNEPRIEAFWFAGGIPPPSIVKSRRKYAYFPEDAVDYPVDRPIQYLGSPNFQLRHRLPLPAIITQEESENASDFNVPVFKYDPKVLGLQLERRHGTNIPGFWPGDESEFGFLSYHKCGHLMDHSLEDKPDALKVQAVLGSWSWLLAQANYLGFSTFNDVTYPLTNQMIITNGEWWTFCVYQLNTTLVHSHHIDENPRRNICWMTEPMRLFEKIENDKIYGLNDKVLEHLVKFYSNEPRERKGVNMKPYMKHEGLIANVTGVHRRTWLEDRFKLLVSNRPRHKPLPEIYNWQDIYMRKFQTRPMEKKRAPWQLGINSWHRKLDEHGLRYIPRVIRGGKIGAKWERAFYPK